MIIYYEKRDRFSNEEIDLIHKSTTSPLIKYAIDKYKSNFNHYYLTLFSCALLISALIFYAYHCVYTDQFNLFYITISLIIYLIIEELVLLNDKYMIINRIIKKCIDMCHSTYDKKRMMRRLRQAYPIRISLNDYHLINGYYVHDHQSVYGMKYIRVTDGKIYFNPINDNYVKCNEENYATILHALNKRLIRDQQRNKKLT